MFTKKIKEKRKMTFEDFDKFQSDLLSEVTKMRDTKGKEYANSENRFANFVRLEERLNISAPQIGWIYLTKHLDSIENYFKTGREGSEKIRGRFVDAIVYLTLIAGMLFEKQMKEMRYVFDNSLDNSDIVICDYCRLTFINRKEYDAHVDTCIHTKTNTIAPF